MAVSRRRLSGLNTEANYREAPEGALGEALNVVCRRLGIIEPRPGMYQSAVISALADAQRIVPFDGDVVALDDTEAVQLSSGSNITNQGYSAGQLQGFDGFCSAAEMRGNLYIGTQDGVQKVLSKSATGAFFAGEPSFIEFADVTVNASAEASENWLQVGDGCAYRFVVRQEDGNGVVRRSSPSHPMFVENAAAGARRLKLDIYLNTNGYFSNHWIEVYRTASSSAGVPADSYFLVQEHPITVGIIAAGMVTLYDTKPNTELGEELYTNPGLGDSPYNPPRPAKVLAAFAGSLFCGNLTSWSYQFLRSAINVRQVPDMTVDLDVTVGLPTATLNSQSPNYPGLQFREGMVVQHATYFPSGARVTDITGSTVTFDTNASASGSGVTMNASDIIEVTNGVSTERYLANFIVRGSMTNLTIHPAATTGPSGLVNARYVDGYFDFDGTGLPTRWNIYLEAMPDAGPLQIRVTNAVVRWGGQINEYAAGFGDMEADIEPALLEWSLLDQPESFIRGIEQTYVGDRGKALWAAVESGRRLYLTKADEGIYVLDGETHRSGFRLEKLTQQHKPMSPRHICAGPDGLYVWTTEGVVEIGAGGGIKPLTAQRITSKLRRFEASETTLLGNMWFADSEVHLTARQTLADQERAVHLVYNTQTGEWTEWQLSAPSVVGCAPGRPLYGELARMAVLTNDAGTVHLWQVPAIVTESGNEVPPEYYAADLLTGSTQMIATPQATSEANVYSVFLNSALLALPSAGDMLISIAEQWKGIVTDVEHVIETVYEVTFYSRDDDPTVSTLIQVLYAFMARVKLRPQTSTDPLLWRHWIGAYWEMLGPMSLYRCYAGASSSDSEIELRALQKSRKFPPYDDLTLSQMGWAPRYLFHRKHATAREVEPYLQIEEAGAIWALGAVSMEERRASRLKHRNV